MTAPAEVIVDTPEIFGYLYDPPLGAVRYRGSHGGRGGGQSWQIARALLIHGAEKTLRILCVREFQSSIRDSVHKLLSDQLEAVGLGSFYQVTQSSIVGLNGTEFLFKGLRRDVAEIKSTEGIDICWVEEAQRVSESSWEVLIPTIRKEGSEIWFSFNPDLETDPTYQRFVVHPEKYAPRSIIRRVNYRDNPFLPAVLAEEAEQLLRTDPEAYATVWGGEPWSRSDAEVFSGKWAVEDFDSPRWVEEKDPRTGRMVGHWVPEWDGPYFGADYGFANDPAVLDRMWIAPDPKGGKKLMVDYEVYGVKLDSDDLYRRFCEVPGAKDYVIRADSARPETTHELARRGLRVESAPKWEGSVKDGIAHMRGYTMIVLHPRCTLSIIEARRYRYKTDPLTDDVLPVPIDKHNHSWDAKRYGLAPLIRQRRVGIA